MQEEDDMESGESEMSSDPWADLGAGERGVPGEADVGVSVGICMSKGMVGV